MMVYGECTQKLTNLSFNWKSLIFLGKGNAYNYDQKIWKNKQDEIC